MGLLLLVLDAGSGGAKSFIVNEEGSIITSALEEWNRDDWCIQTGWASVRKSIKSVLSRKGIESKNIKGIATTSMREEFVILDAEGKEVNYTVKQDTSSHGEKFIETYGLKLYKESGHWPIPGWIAAAKLKLLKDKRPDVMERMKKLLMLSDWVAYSLGADPYSEGSSACETSLFDIVKMDWAWNTINELDFPADIFPPIKRSSDYAGSVSDQAAGETGLTAGTPIFVGGADTQCGLLGSGAINDGDVVAVCGTTTPVQMVTSKPVLDPQYRTWTNNHVLPGSWILESNAGRTGIVFRWLRETLMAGNGEGVYEEMDRLAEISPPGAYGLQAFLGPHVFNAGPPYWKGDKLGNLDVPPTILGSANFTVGELARAIIEANCYAVKANLNQLIQITGIAPEKIGMCGGGSRSRLWSEIQAEVVGLPVSIPKERDATANGAAACAAVGAGIFQDLRGAVKSMVSLEETVTPDANKSRKYQELYQKWMSTRERLGGTF